MYLICFQQIHQQYNMSNSIQYRLIRLLTLVSKIKHLQNQNPKKMDILQTLATDQYLMTLKVKGNSS